MTTVGVAIPSIPPRGPMLRRAIGSALRQTRPADALSVVIDTEGHGAAWTRNRAWRALRTDYVAFLDDDDELLPNHIEALLRCAEEQEADMVYAWYDVEGGTDPHPQNYGVPFDPVNPCQTAITCLWKREALERIDGFPRPDDALDATGARIGEDYCAVLNLTAAGGRIVHLPEKTWIYHHHLTNTSGRADRWVARC